MTPWHRRTISVASKGEAKRDIGLDIPVGVDDGDKIVLERQGHQSEFKGAADNSIPGVELNVAEHAMHLLCFMHIMLMAVQGADADGLLCG